MGLPGQGAVVGGTHIGFVTTGLKDELLRLVLPALHGGVGGGQAWGPQGQFGFAVLLLQHTGCWLAGSLWHPMGSEANNLQRGKGPRSRARGEGLI